VKGKETKELGKPGLLAPLTLIHFYLLITACVTDRKTKVTAIPAGSKQLHYQGVYNSIFSSSPSDPRSSNTGCPTQVRKLAKHNNHRLQSRKLSEKSRFDEESAAINLQPKTFAECTQVLLKRATLNTDGRGCFARSPGKGATKCHRNTHSTNTRGPPVAGALSATHEGIG
jgi:hypothetical protein